MNPDFIVDALENFADWGGPIADIFEALGDIFGDDGLGALGNGEEGNGDEDNGNGGNGNEGSGLVGLSSNLSSDDADGE